MTDSQDSVTPTAGSNQVDALVAEIETGLDVLLNADLIIEDQVAREFGLL